MNDPMIDLLRNEVNRRVASAPPAPTPERVLLAARKQRRLTIAITVTTVLLIGGGVPALVQQGSPKAVSTIAKPTPSLTPSPPASPTVTGTPRVVGLAIDAAINALARANCNGTITAIVNNAAPVGQVIAQRTTGDHCQVSISVSAGPAGSAARCSNLTITAGQVGSGLGHSGFPLNFRNSGPFPCTLNGYPTVTATESGSGRKETGTDRPSGYLGGTDLRVPTLLLRPGDAVSSLVEGTNNPVGNAASCTDLTKLRVTVNGRTTSVRPTLSNCSGLNVHPYLPGTTGTAR